MSNNRVRFSVPMSFSTAAALLLLLAAGSALSQLPEDAGFQSSLPKFEEGTSRFINGDPKLWKENASHRDDVTIMGGWGAYAKGWKAVDPWYDWAAARFADSGAKVKVEYISSGISGDLAYTVAIERSNVRLADKQEPAGMVLRVTHLFRKENGSWKLVHRHADPVMEKAAPDTVLQQ